MNFEDAIRRHLTPTPESMTDIMMSELARGSTVPIITPPALPESSDRSSPIPQLPIESLSDFPPYQDESENKDILIKGRWLERGGSAWWISTAGTGKSIAALQMAFKWSEGRSFAGLQPNGQKLKVWIIQTEDSRTRVTIDREDIIAELTERIPEVDWRKTATKIKFVNVGPHFGADFIDRLDGILSIAKRKGSVGLPDVIIINPFLSIVGGPVTDGTFVTPFLRGGEINREATIGLQALLEKYRIGAVIFHHTPKPPTDTELKSWLKSAFPEYQGAGSSDITNWGRSFITMMRVPERPKVVVLTAGKNGQEIGWEEIEGARRRYMAYSDATGITGRRRHAWRELTEEELNAVCKRAVDEKTDEQVIVELLKLHPSTATEIRDLARARMPQARADRAWRTVACNCEKYEIYHAVARRIGERGQVEFYGQKYAVEQRILEWKSTKGEY